MRKIGEMFVGTERGIHVREGIFAACCGRVLLIFELTVMVVHVSERMFAVVAECVSST